MSPRFSRLQLLHRSYRRTGRWGWLISRRIRPFGWGVILLASTTAVLGIDLKSSALYMLFCTSASLLLVCFGWLFFRKAKVSARRNLPRYGTANVPLYYEVEIRNDGRKKLSAMLFEEWPPDPRPDYETFANTPEPGEERRNIVDRKLLYYRWLYLQELERGFTAIEAVQSPRQIAAQESASIRFQLVPRFRGVIELAELRVLLPDPVGLFQRCFRATSSRDQIVVLPKHYPLAGLISAGLSQVLGEDQVTNQGRGHDGDFTHLRDYAPGDSLRSVDWKSWARTGKPIVREYEDSYSARFGILLDLTGVVGECFEEALSVAASFAALRSEGDFPLTTMFLSERAFPLDDGAEGARHDQLLEALARAKPRVEPDYPALEGVLRAQGEGLTTLLVILPSYTEAQRDFLTRLQTLPFRVVTLVLSGDERPAERIHFLNPATVAQDLGRVAEQLFVT